MTAPVRQLTTRLARQFGSFTPSTDVPSLLAWYRADTTTNAGGFVSQLTDKKGSVQFTQGTGSKQPALIASGSDPNGRACVVFDGVDDALINATGLGAMNDITVFGVVRSAVANASSAGRYFGIGNAGTDAKSIGIQTSGATFTDPLAVYTNPAVNSSRAVESSGNTTVYVTSTPRILCARHDSTASASTTPITRSRLGTPRTTNNGTSATISTIAALAASFGANKTGAANFLQFGLYEWMVCNALLTDDQCRTVEAYLAGYYGLL